ncbi:1852_t:CDS:2, partial [Racocetra persica]
FDNPDIEDYEFFLEGKHDVAGLAFIVKYRDEIIDDTLAKLLS